MAAVRGRGRGRGRGRTQGRGRGQLSRQKVPASRARVSDVIVRGRGRGQGRGSRRSSSRRAQAAAVVVAEIGIEESDEMPAAPSIPQHQLMLPSGTQASTRNIVTVPACQAIVPITPAIVLAPVRDSAALEAIMSNVVAETSRNQYNTKAVGFVLWCYKNHPLLMDSELAIKLDEVMVEGEDELHRHTVLYRKIIKVAIEEMNRHDINSCPIILSSLTFHIFSEYLLSLKPRIKKKKKR